MPGQGRSLTIGCRRPTVSLRPLTSGRDRGCTNRSWSICVRWTHNAQPMRYFLKLRSMCPNLGTTAGCSPGTALVGRLRRSLPLSPALVSSLSLRQACCRASPSTGTTEVESLAHQKPAVEAKVVAAATTECEHPTVEVYQSSLKATGCHHSILTQASFRQSRATAMTYQSLGIATCSKTRSAICSPSAATHMADGKPANIRMNHTWKQLLS
mmetsp:Transcript_39021/g.125422  ORF Transcript_39021/g.125422 Transcript_39021/m.125422 type:complete len:212 (+) Transcript_39021:1328-1963(+)